MDESLNIVHIIKLIRQWRKQLLIVCGLALVISIVVSDPHIIKPKFKSSSIILSSNPSMTTSSSLFIENSGNYFGTEADVDRVLSVATSTPLKIYIIRKYKLFEHYKIDSATSNYPNTHIMKEFEDNYSVIKNDKGAIEITIYDTDKDLAATMCNDIVEKVDDINNTILLENKKKIYNLYVNKIKSKQGEMMLLSDSIVKTKSKYDAIYTLLDINRAVKLSDSLKRAMDHYDEQLTALEEQRKAGLKELNNTISLSEQYKSTLNKDVPSIYIVEKAYPAEKKAKPIRWIIILSSIVGSFFLALLFLVFMERFRALQKNLLNDSKA